ncbi:hypothetical protein EVA_11630 [gut metagenome]|uniref:Uncharacterized protein n=1 Tax=gut metagenome TaxID=749906 RepID=J9CJL9_9ZZZZ
MCIRLYLTKGLLLLYQIMKCCISFGKLKVVHLMQRYVNSCIFMSPLYGINVIITLVTCFKRNISSYGIIF